MENNSVMDNAPLQAATEATPASQERMLPQSTVNELIGHAKREAAEKAASRAVEEYKKQIQQESAHYSQSQSINQTPRGLSEDEIRRLTSDELDRKRQEWEKQYEEKTQADIANRIVTSYREKIASGREKYEDFETVTNNVNMARYPNVVQLLAEHSDNAADILYNLAQRRGKLAEIETLCERSPEDAIYEMKRLSDSIKANESAATIRNPKSPLSQQKASNSGTESGPLSIADYKKLYRG